MNEIKEVLAPRVIIMLLVFIISVPMLPLFISWQWDWWEAWAYAALNILGFAVSRYLAGRQHPDLLVERGQFMQHDNPEPWDKVLSPLLGMGSGVLPLLAGLEARFFPTVQFSLWVKILAIFVIMGGYTLASYALIANRFFSGMVRIQSERGHHVVDTGPYRWARHPGYAGSLITYPFIPLLLDSRWAFIPAVLLMIVIIVRTGLEDRVLQEKLPGYDDYALRVKYRLIPGIW